MFPLALQLITLAAGVVDGMTAAIFTEFNKNNNNRQSWIPPQQRPVGFQEGERGCTDAVYALRQLCERSVEHDRALQLVFVDQEKAFDRVDREKLWRVLEQYKIKGQLLDNIKALYGGSKSAVRTLNVLTNWFSVKRAKRDIDEFIYDFYVENLPILPKE